jgi:hypothetical protein
MTRAFRWMLTLAVLGACPAAAAADGLILAAEVGESYAYYSPWESGEPSTNLGLRFFSVDNDVDLGLAVRYGKPWGGDLTNAGQLGLDFEFRFHDDVYGGDDFEPFFMCGVGYSHLWAEVVPPAGTPPDSPAGWTTRNSVGLRAGGGFLVVVDEFYFDLTLYALGELLWPEPSWVAGGAASIALGVYID